MCKSLQQNFTNISWV